MNKLPNANRTHGRIALAGGDLRQVSIERAGRRIAGRTCPCVRRFHREQSKMSSLR